MTKKLHTLCDITFEAVKIDERITAYGDHLVDFNAELNTAAVLAILVAALTLMMSGLYLLVWLVPLFMIPRIVFMIRQRRHIDEMLARLNRALIESDLI